MTKCALITGASGFIASHLAKKLLSSGWKIGLLVRPHSQLDSQLLSAKIYSYDGTLGSIDQCLKDLKPNIVFHLASLFISEHKPQDIPALIDSNILFGTQLLESMTSHQVHHLINTGTSWQHFNGDPYHPVNLYAATKQAFEAILQYYVEAKHIRCITLKLFDSYGPDDHRKKLVNLLIASASKDEHLELSPGEQLIDLVYIDDIVKAFLIATEQLDKQKYLSHEIYGLSSGTRISIRQLADIISRLSGKALTVSWSARAYREREVMDPWLPSANLPDWEPQVSLEQGISNLLSRAHN